MVLDDNISEKIVGKQDRKFSREGRHGCNFFNGMFQ